jgi:peptide subunit release factor 1 (eRF1)
VKLLTRELATAGNIKSASTRKDVTQALKRGIDRLAREKKAAFVNGVALFSGWSMQHV